MAANGSNWDQPIDDAHWSRIAELIDRRDHGESVDASELEGSDPQLAERLRECLAGFGWLEQALSGIDSEYDRAASPDRLPESIGEYNIIRELGRGGMGVVYEAVHQGLGRRVALKVLFDSSFQSATARERFLREARTSASLHHTNIVPVFDSGSADGHLYYAMQLIEGKSLEELSAESRHANRAKDTSVATAATATPPPSGSTSRQGTLDADRVARLGLQAAEALAYAHGRGVIHRDIKPSNLLVDSNGTVWIADFGLARRPDDPSVTASGARLGTPRYMSPEQATAQWESLDARTDVYSLGVTLYELLSGFPLFADSTPQQLMFRIIRTEPVRLRQLNRRVPRDLETIVLKAMAKRPADRYPSAAALADDLRRFLEHQPVRARRIGPLGRFTRWCWREPLVATVSVIAVTVLAGVVGAYQYKLTGERDAAVEAEQLARLELAESLFQQSCAVRESSQVGRRWASLDLLRRSFDIRRRPEIRVEAVRSLQQFDVRCVQHLGSFGHPATAVAFAPSGRMLAVANETGAAATLSLWDFESQSVSARLAAPEAIRSLAFSPDGQWLAGATERHVCLWQLSSAQLRVLASEGTGLSSVAFTPDSQRLAGFAGGLCLWDVNSGQLLERLTNSAVELGFVEITADGRWLAAAITTRDGGRPEVLRWSLVDLQPSTPLIPTDARLDPLAVAIGIISMAASPDGSLLAAATGDSRVRIWQLASGRQIAALDGHRAPITAMAFLPDDGRLVTSDGFEVKLWSANDGTHLATLVGANSAATGPLTTLAASRDGRLATAGDSCRIWELATPSFHRVIARQRTAASALAASPDGRFIAWLVRGGSDCTLHVWDETASDLRYAVQVPIRGDAVLAFAEQGETLVLAGAGSPSIQVLEVATGQRRGEWPTRESVTAAVASPDGREVALAHTDNVIRRWNVATGQVAGACVGHVGPVMSLAYSPDGRQIVAANENRDTTSNRTLHVWEATSGRLVHQFAPHGSVAFGAAFSPNGRRVASCGGDRNVKIWNAETGNLEMTLAGHTQPVRSVAFGHSGAFIVACGLDGRVLVWDSARGELMADLSARASGSLSHMAFVGDAVVACGGPHRWTQDGPGAIERWDLHEIERQLSRLGLHEKMTATEATAEPNPNVAAQ